MLRIVLYEILDGRMSPSQWARDCQTSKEVQYLARGIDPRRTTLYEFRDRAEKFINAIHKQLLQQANDEGVLDGREASIDGTFIGALASRHRIVNQSSLDKRMQRLDSIRERDLEGEKIPDTEIPNWMAKTIGGREEQQERFQTAKTVIQERIEKNARKSKRDRLDETKIFVSTSDPKVPISRDKKKVFGPLWPTQFVTDVKSNLIVATAVFPLATDVGTIGPMIDMSQENLAHSLKKLLADAGYTSILDLIDCKARGIDLYAPVQENGLTEQNKAKKPVKVIQIPRSEFQFSPNTNRYTCPAGHEMPGTRNGKVRRFDGRELASTSYQLPVKICQACPLKESCLRSGKMNRRINRVEGQEVLDAQREKMTEEIAKATRTTRAQTAERSFAEVKTRACLNRIGCKTIERANTIVALHVVAINLLRLYRLRQARKTVEISG